jgi:Family of unknown function (DUF6402)
MGEVINYSALQNSSRATSSKAINQASLQTLSSPINNIFWSDKNGKTLSGYASYGDIITLNISTQIPGVDLYVNIYKRADRSGFIDVQKGKFVSDPTNKTYRINIDSISLPNIYDSSSIFCRITYYGSPPLFTDLKSNDIEVPGISFDMVPYIPVIIKAKGWTIALKCMEKWFNNPYNPGQNKTDIVVSDILKMNWVLSFQYLKEFIENGFFIIKFSPTRFSIWEKIKQRIKAQVKNGLMNLPEEGQTVSFGTKDATPERSAIDNHLVTRFDRYYIYEVPYRSPSLGQGDLIPTIDDFYAAVANCTFRYIALGDISKASGKYKIQVKQLGVYVYDTFDFEGEQDLGYWNVKTNDVGRTFIGGGSQGTLITNKIFRDWRDRNRKGQDYTNYSDVSIRDASFAFEASESELKP